MGRIKWSWRQNWKKNGLPLRENCDPLDPRQAFLPAFTGFALKGAPIPLPTVYYEELSEHLVEYLGIPVVETGHGTDKVRRLLEPIGESMGWEPRRKYQPPSTVMNRAVASGKWVTPDTPDVQTKTVKEVLQELPQSDREQVNHAVLEELGIPERQEPPMHTTAKDLGAALGLSTKEIATVLEGWGVERAKPATKVDRGLAVRIIAHHERAKAQR